jgi:hypothetical protein
LLGGRWALALVGDPFEVGRRRNLHIRPDVHHGAATATAGFTTGATTDAKGQVVGSVIERCSRRE